MSLAGTLIQQDFTPIQGGSFGNIQDTIRVTDSAGAAITISGAYAEQDDLAPATHATWDTFYRTNISYTQPMPTVVDITATYTNAPNSQGKSSTDPQDVERELPGYASISTAASVFFLDIWNRGNPDPFYAPNASVADPGNVTDREGDLVGQGNIDSGGLATSFPVIRHDITVSLTRDVDSDELTWAKIDPAIGTRFTGGTYLGYAAGSILFTGARTVETFSTGAVNYELNFVVEAWYHLRQRVDRDADGLAITSDLSGYGGTPPTPQHATHVYVIQPFPASTIGTWGGTLTDGLMSAAEYALVNGKVT